MEMIQSTEPSVGFTQSDAQATLKTSTGAESLTFAVIFLVFTVLISVVGTFGNLLIFITIVLYPKMRSVTNYVILSLAVTDLTVCMVTIPIAIYNGINLNIWRLGPIVCYLWSMGDFLLTTTSIWHLCVLSIDRYLALFRPHWYRTKRKTWFALLLISISWGIGIMIALSTLIGSDGYYHNVYGTVFCFIMIPTAGFAVFVFSVSFAIPTCILLAVYMKMKFTFWGWVARVDIPVVASGLQNKVDNAGGQDGERLAVTSTSRSMTGEPSLQKPPSNGPSLLTSQAWMGSSSDCLSSEATKKQHPEIMEAYPAAQGVEAEKKTDKKKKTRNIGYKKEDRKKNLKKEKKAAIVIAIVVITFLVCWGPFFIVAIISSLCSSCTLMEGIFPIVNWLGYSNSALNPIIYTIFNHRFRSAFKNILLFKFSKRHDIG
ncbi:octopamine receptor-like [Apostichopus japonicus]|uniref:octopamine receptor-like n=1 Tax=Stichopus japonicus TaxID=307972 RepID=UPI003AB179F6